MCADGCVLMDDGGGSGGGWWKKEGLEAGGELLSFDKRVKRDLKGEQTVARVVSAVSHLL